MLAPQYAKTGTPIGGKKRVAGLRLRATDADVDIGEGPEVVGPALELVRAADRHPLLIVTWC